MEEDSVETPTAPEEPVVDSIQTKEQILTKHRTEKKELQATIQKIKKTINNCKKRKKEANAEIAKLEAEMKERHEKELKEYRDSVVSEVTDEVADMSIEGTNGESEEQSGAPRVSRAAKRRAKKTEAAQLREAELEKERKFQMANSPRSIELRLMAKLLLERQLLVTDIPPDGNCMYAALSHQLKGEKTMENLRKICADYMLAHESDFLPFLVDPDTEELLDSGKYSCYCEKIANTPVWGGQPELRALSEALQRKIQVIQAEGPDIILGEQYTGEALQLAYYRHAYSLGEHYNSVTKAPS